MSRKGRIAAFLFACMLTLVACVAFSQTGAKKSGSTPKTNPPKETKTNSDAKETTVVVQNAPPFQIPSPWPNPLARPDGTKDQVARILAKKVLAGGPDALPALERAALESGYSIHDLQGKVLFSPDSKADLGMSMLTLDLVVAADLTKRGDVSTVAMLEEELRKKPELDGLDFRKWLASALQGSTDRVHPGKRFWAQFVSAFGWESERKFSDPLLGKPDDELCGAQTMWLLYKAACHAKVAEGQAEIPLLSSGSDGEPQNWDAAFRDVAKYIKDTPPADFAQYVKDQKAKGKSSAQAFVEVVRQRIIARCIKITANVLYQPLTRAKVFNGTGGTAKQVYSVEFDASADVRRDYASAVALAPNATPLPPNGTVTISRLVIQEVPNQCDLKSDPNPSPDSQSFLLVGKPQKLRLSANPIPVDTTEKVRVRIPVLGTEFRCTTDLRIRNWRDSGLLVTVNALVTGSGTIVTEDNPKITKEWRIFRMLSGQLLMERDFPVPIFSTVKPNELARYMSWMRGDPAIPPESWQYHVNDVVRFVGPPMAGGCGEDSDPVESGTSILHLQHRPPDSNEAKQLLFNNGRAELDNVDGKMSFESTLPRIPVTDPLHSMELFESLENIELLNGLEVHNNIFGLRKVEVGKAKWSKKTLNFDGKAELVESGKGSKTVNIRFIFTFEQGKSAGGPELKPSPSQLNAIVNWVTKEIVHKGSSRKH